MNKSNSDACRANTKLHQGTQQKHRTNENISSECQLTVRVLQFVCVCVFAHLFVCVVNTVPAAVSLSSILLRSSCHLQSTLGVNLRQEAVGLLVTCSFLSHYSVSMSVVLTNTCACNLLSYLMHYLSFMDFSFLIQLRFYI